MADSFDYCWNNTRHSISNKLVGSTFGRNHGVFGFMHRVCFCCKDNRINKKENIKMNSYKLQYAATSYNRTVYASAQERLGLHSARSPRTKVRRPPRLIPANWRRRSCFASPYMPPPTSQTAGTLGDMPREIVDKIIIK